MNDGPQWGGVVALIGVVLIGFVVGSGRGGAHAVSVSPFRLLEEGWLLEALSATRSAAPAGYRRQVRAWFFALMGDERCALSAHQGLQEEGAQDQCATWGTLTRLLARTPAELCRAQSASEDCARPAFETVVEITRGKRLLFVNEAHHVSRHRTFMAALLPALWADGYRYFAAEALSPSLVAAIEKHGDVLLTKGPYVSDPQFAALLRRAHALGFRLVAYDQTAEQAKACAGCDGRRANILRDEDEAKNLFAATFDRDPHARVIVYGGFAHGRRCLPKESGFEIPRMGYHLARRLGAQMVSVSQTAWWRAPDPSPEDVEDSSPFAPIALPGDSCVDLRVAHRLDDPGEMGASWKAWVPDRRKITVPVTDATLAYPLLVEAHGLDQASNAVPFDRALLWRPGRARLWVPEAARITIRIVDSKGRRRTVDVLAE